MANRYLIASGNSDDPSIYDGGTLPAANDVLRLNNYTWNVVANITLAEIRCDALAPAVATTGNRRCVVSNGVVVTATSYIVGLTGEGSIGLFCGTAGAAYTVVCPEFFYAVCGPLAGNTMTCNGNANTVGMGYYWILFTGQGSVVWNGQIANPAGYIYDTVLGGSLTVNGSIVQNGGNGIFQRGNHQFTLNGSLTVNDKPLIDLGTNTYDAVTLNGPVYAGTAPAVRSRSLVQASGPLYNNGAIMALSCDRVRMMDGDVTWQMARVNLDAVSLFSQGTLMNQPPENKVETGFQYGNSNELLGTLDPVTISAGQIADLANALGLHLTPQVLAAITS